MKRDIEWRDAPRPGRFSRWEARHDGVRLFCELLRPGVYAIANDHRTIATFSRLPTADDLAYYNIAG